MTIYSVAEAKNRLSELIDRAMGGEGVVVARHGTPVVEIRPIQSAAKPVTRADLEQLLACTITPLTAPSEDAGTLLSRLRDDEWQR